MPQNHHVDQNRHSRFICSGVTAEKVIHVQVKEMVSFSVTYNIVRESLKLYCFIQE